MWHTALQKELVLAPNSQNASLFFVTGLAKEKKKNERPNRTSTTDSRMSLIVGFYELKIKGYILRQLFMSLRSPRVHH